MSSEVPSSHTLFGRVVHFHVLRDADGICLIDAGFIGAIPALEKYLADIDRSFAEIHTILLTHGHLDHTLNVAEIQERSGCKVYAPAADRDHIAGTHPYRGASRLCGLSESLGRLVLRYQPPQIDHWFQPGEIFDDICGGLEVIALPGHTAGHSGFLSRRHDILFAGDLFAAYGRHPKSPPHFFNTDTCQARASIIAAAEIATQRQLSKIALNHSRIATPELLMLDLEHLAKVLDQ